MTIWLRPFRELQEQTPCHVYCPKGKKRGKEKRVCMCVCVCVYFLKILKVFPRWIKIDRFIYNFVFIITDKVKTRRGGGRRCRCYERWRGKTWGDWSLSHTRWSVTSRQGRGERRGCKWYSVVYTLKYISLVDFDIKCLSVGFRQPMNLCTYVSEERFFFEPLSPVVFFPWDKPRVYCCLLLSDKARVCLLSTDKTRAK